MSRRSDVVETSIREGRNSRDLFRFRCWPTERLSDSIIFSVESRALGRGGQHRVPSSRYQAFSLNLVTSALICLLMGWRVKAKPRGPGESPCCTPLQLRIVILCRRYRGWPA